MSPRLPTPSRRDVLPAVRIAISVVGPLAVLRLTGHLDWSLYAAFGAFASIYGRRGSHLDRARMQSAAGLLLVASVTAGTAVSRLAATDGRTADVAVWVAVIGTALAAASGSVAADLLRWSPPGPLFFVFGFGACASVPSRPGSVPVALAVSAATASLAVLIGACGASVRLRRRPPTSVAARASAWPPVARHALTHLVSAAVAGGFASALGLGHAYWAAVSAVVPLAAADTPGRLTRAWHRLLGTGVGLVLAAVLLGVLASGWAVVAAAAVLQVGAELFVAHHYAVAMVFVTPMALLMTRLVVDAPAGPLLRDRAATTLLGVGVGVLAVLLLNDRRAWD